MKIYQYHFCDKDIRYDIINHLRPRYRYDIISSKKRYVQCLVVAVDVIVVGEAPN
jgi:hypothetical protein